MGKQNNFKVSGGNVNSDYSYKLICMLNKPIGEAFMVEKTKTPKNDNDKDKYLLPIPKHPRNMSHYTCIQWQYIYQGYIEQMLDYIYRILQEDVHMTVVDDICIKTHVERLRKPLIEHFYRTSDTKRKDFYFFK